MLVLAPAACIVAGIALGEAFAVLSGSLKHAVFSALASANEPVPTVEVTVGRKP